MATLLLTLFYYFAAMGINFFFARLKKLAKRWVTLGRKAAQDKARRIAANIAELPELLRKP